MTKLLSTIDNNVYLETIKEQKSIKNKIEFF